MSDVVDYQYTDYESHSDVEWEMSLEITSSVAVGVFAGISAFMLVAGLIFYIIKKAASLFTPAQMKNNYAELFWFTVWLLAVAFLSLNFRTAAEFFQYATLVLASISTILALTAISLNVGSSSGFGKWRERELDRHNPFETEDWKNRNGLADDTRRVFRSALAIAVALASAVVALRLAVFKVEGHWFPFLLS